jgi:mono/diheme cytochrome c family protein
MSPADLTSDYIKKVPDGSIFFTITYGGVGKDEQMPGHGDAISPEERWHIVNYIKHVLSWW